MTNMVVAFIVGGAWSVAMVLLGIHLSDGMRNKVLGEFVEEDE